MDGKRTKQLLIFRNIIMSRPDAKLEFESHGYWPLSNFGGLQIQISDCGSWARLKWFDDPPQPWQEIKHAVVKGEYVTLYSQRYYLFEFTRINSVSNDQ